MRSLSPQVLQAASCGGARDGVDDGELDGELGHFLSDDH